MAYRTNFPYKAWRLTPGMKPVEVEIVGVNQSWNRRYKEVRASNESAYAIADLYETKAEAIESGYAVLRNQKAKLDKQQANIDKKLAALLKAE